jgi:exodeoxyribonuclease-3
VEWLDAEQPDVVCLQEIKAKPEQVPEALCNLGGYACYWHGAGGYSGVGLHIRREAFADEPKFSHPSFDNETRVVQAEIGNLVVASVYVPNGGKDFEAKMRFLQALSDYVRETLASGRQLVVCGDLNVALTDTDVHPKEKKPNIIGQLPQERELISTILSHGMVDVGRALDPDNAELFTWWAPWRNMRERNIGWRIDYILASRAVAARARESRVLRLVGTSDHAPLVITFADASVD